MGYIPYALYIHARRSWRGQFEYMRLQARSSDINETNKTKAANISYSMTLRRDSGIHPTYRRPRMRTIPHKPYRRSASDRTTLSYSPFHMSLPEMAKSLSCWRSYSQANPRRFSHSAYQKSTTASLRLDLLRIKC